MQGGRILWHPYAGANPVWGAINDLYQQLLAENGTLAYPVEGEIPTAIPGLVLQRFEFGAIYWDQDRGARAVAGPIYARYLADGAEGGTLGEPTGGECALPKGGATTLREGP